MIDRVCSIVALLILTGCTTPEKEIPAGTPTFRPYFSIISPQWKGTLTLLEDRVLPGTRFSATFTLLNDSSEPTLVPVDLDRFFRLGHRSTDPGAFAFTILEPPEQEPIVACRELLPGKRLSVTVDYTAPIRAGHYELYTILSSVPAVAFEVTERKTIKSSPAQPPP